ncbi:hypothetical protein TKK_0010654 [Trichogramma kaykai]
MVITISILNYLQMSTVKYIVGRFLYLGEDMIHMLEELETNSTLLTNEQKMRVINRNICINIRKQQESIELFESFQQISKEKYLIVIIIVTTMLSLSGLWFIIIIPYDKVTALKVASSMASAAMILLYLIYASQEVINACDQLNRDCYDAKWYMFPSIERRLILLMILRSTYPCTLTAGPTIPMNFETGGNILKMVLTYLTALQRIFENNNFSMDSEKSFMMLQSHKEN